MVMIMFVGTGFSPRLWNLGRGLKPVPTSLVYRELKLAPTLAPTED